MKGKGLESNAIERSFPFHFSTENKLTILIMLWIIDKIIMIILFWAMKQSADTLLILMNACNSTQTPKLSAQKLGDCTKRQSVG